MINYKKLMLFFFFLCAGFAGNYFNYEFFYKINFLFGSIFTFLALQTLGIRRATAIAFLISIYTYFLWGQPYAIIIFIAEVLFVGLVMKHKKMSMVLAELLYWLLLGMPLIYTFYFIIMQNSLELCFIIFNKQAVNGIFNALIARLFFTLYGLKNYKYRTSYQEIFYNILAFFILYPALIIVGHTAQSNFDKTDQQMRNSLTKRKQELTFYLNNLLNNRNEAVASLAEIAISHSTKHLAPFFDTTNKHEKKFEWYGFIDKNKKITYQSSLLAFDHNIFTQDLLTNAEKSKLPKMASAEIFNNDAHDSHFAIAVPVISAGKFEGISVGIVTLQPIKDFFELVIHDTQTNYTLIDHSGKVLLTNRLDQNIEKPFVRESGTYSHNSNNEIKHWFQTLPIHAALAEGWKNSSYVLESNIENADQWKLILEQPIAPYLITPHAEFSRQLSILFVILCISLIIAEYLSSQLFIALNQLTEITNKLPSHLDEKKAKIEWPQTGILEANHLINNFKLMTHLLSNNIQEKEQLNRSLEARVKERTRDLEEANEKLESYNTAISHDLRAPLNSINSFSQLLLSEHSENTSLEVKDALSRITGATKKMGLVIAGLLEISHISNTELKKEVINLSEMARSIANDLKALTPEREVNLFITENIMAYGDSRLLTIIMSNLLNNAFKFTSKNHITFIQFGIHDKTYFIRDNGAGFDSRHAQKLFKPFERLHTADEFPGTGIGLTTVERAIKRHDGRIWAESSINSGTTFYFKL